MKKLGVALLILLLIPTGFAVFAEWFEEGGISPEIEEPFIPVQPIEIACGRDFEGEFTIRTHIPANAEVKLRIPRSYKLGFGNRLSNIVEVMNGEKGLLDECTTIGEPGQEEPPGPYICADRQDKLAETWVQSTHGDGESELEGDVIVRYPGSTFDGGQVVTELWPAHSIIYLDSFVAFNGDVPYLEEQADLDDVCLGIREELESQKQNCAGLEDAELSACESNNANLDSQAGSECSSVIADYNGIDSSDVFVNEFPRKSLTAINLLSNGREGEGDPYYITIQLDNKKKKCRDKGCVEDHFEANGGVDPSGPEWTSGLEGWENGGSPLEFGPQDLASGPSGNYFAIWGSRIGNLFSGSIGDIFQNLWDAIRGKRKSVCVFGCKDVTVELTFKTASRAFLANQREELVGEDYSARTDAVVCDLHSEAAAELPEFLDDGYKYWCESTGAYMRQDFRIQCTNRVSQECVVSIEGNNDLAQSHILNPPQIYRDHARTEEGYIEEFTNPITGLVNGGAGVEVEFSSYAADFDPDKNIQICQARSCLSAWFNATGFTSDSGSRNLCCGDDLDDVGYIQRAGDKLYSCVQNPDGLYEWVASDGEHARVSSEVEGNIYDVFQESHYEIVTEKVEEEGREFYKRVANTEYNIDFGLVSTGAGWAYCGADNFRGNSDAISAGTSTGALQLAQPGDVVPVEKDGQTHEYLCYEENGQGRFVECFGLDSAEYNDFDLGRNQLFFEPEWSSYSATGANAVRRIGSYETLPITYEYWGEDAPIRAVRRAETRRSLEIVYDKTNGTPEVPSITSEKLPITDWSQFEFLEGDLHFTEVPNLILQAGGQSFPLEDYLVSTPKPDQFNHFIIPIQLGQVDSITFTLNPELYNFEDSVDYTFSVDNLNVIRPGLAYCTKNNDSYVWISDRDEGTTSCTELGLAHTGSMCCGDDGREFYNDEQTAGCWDSNGVDDKERFQVVEVDLNDQRFYFTCKDGRCEHPLPNVQGVDPNNINISLINPREDAYSVEFLKTNKTWTSQSTDRLLFTVNIFEYMYLDGLFQYCGTNAARPTDIAANAVISDSFNLNLVQYTSGGMCLLTNDVYCSPGLGWTDNTDNIEGRDILNETFPVADCPVTSQDQRCIKPNISERIHVSEVPEGTDLTNITAQGCCPADYCWNGVNCIEDESNEGFRPPSFPPNEHDGYRCIAGDWEFSYQKFSPTGTTSGYCANQTQCFSHEFGNTFSEDGGNTCLDSDEYFADFYCEAGDWTSRTKLLAALMAEKGGNEFSVFCDSFDEVLNTLSPVNGQQLESFIIPASDACTITVGTTTVNACANNFCVLNKGGKVAFGTTLNQDLQGANGSISELFNNFGLSEAELQQEIERADDGKINEIAKDGDTYWYYVPDLEILISSEFRLTSFFGDLFDIIRGFFNRLGDFITGSSSDSGSLVVLEEFETVADLNFIKHNQLFDRVFILKTNKFEIEAVHGTQFDPQKGKFIDYVAGEYDGVSNEFCEPIFAFDRSINPKEADIVCRKTGDTFKVFAKGELDVWKDISAKLRLFKE